MIFNLENLETSSNAKEHLNQQLLNQGYAIVKVQGYEKILAKICQKDFFEYIDKNKIGKQDYLTVNVTNLYPSQDLPPNEVIEDFFSYMGRVRSVLLDTINMSYFDDVEWNRVMENEDSPFSYIHSDPQENGVKMYSHVDSPLFTILGALNREGLEALIDKKWQEIKTKDDEVVVINGALLHFMSQKKYPPLYHRVEFKSNRERITIGYLIQPRMDHLLNLPNSKGPITYNRFHEKRLLVM